MNYLINLVKSTCNHAVIVFKFHTMCFSSLSAILIVWLDKYYKIECLFFIQITKDFSFKQRMLINLNLFKFSSFWNGLENEVLFKSATKIAVSSYISVESRIDSSTYWYLWHVHKKSQDSLKLKCMIAASACLITILLVKNLCSKWTDLSLQANIFFNMCINIRNDWHDKSNKW